MAEASQQLWSPNEIFSDKHPKTDAEYVALKNRIFTNIILMADKHNIPKGKMHNNFRLVPVDILCKITQRNYIRRANTCDPAVILLT